MQFLGHRVDPPSRPSISINPKPVVYNICAWIGMLLSHPPCCSYSVVLLNNRTFSRAASNRFLSSMSSATIKHRKRHRMTQFALYMNYFLLGKEIHAYMTIGFTLLSFKVGKLELKLYRNLSNVDHVEVAMKIQQRFHTHRCTMDFDFMFIMNECNDNNKEITDACVYKLYAYVCHLYRTFYLR